MPKRCMMEGNTENVVIIDVDGDNRDDVIIIDDATSLRPKLRGPRGVRGEKRIPLRVVISIDDDASDAHIDPDSGEESCVDLDSGTTSSKESYTASNESNHAPNSADSDGSDCQFIWQGKPPFKLWKCERTYSEKVLSRNNYGLYSESEKGSSESDCSDCEIIEKSFPPQREHCEKASSKRKADFYKADSVFVDEANASAFHTDIGVDAECITEQYPEAPGHSTSSKPQCMNGNLTDFTTTDVGGGMGGTSCDPKPAHIFPKFDQRNSSERTSKLMEDRPFCHVTADVSSKGTCTVSLTEQQSDKHVEPDEENRYYEKSSSWFNQKQRDLCLGTKSCCITTPTDFARDTSFCNILADGKTKVDHVNMGCQERTELPSLELASCSSQYPQMHVKQYQSCLVDASEPAIDLTGCGQQQKERNCLINAHVSPILIDVINTREKLKETEEYKQAAEEEWAARKCQLQLQAEEAQRLRKRRKAETMRLLDMERRQKERVEAIRERQKKDAESMDLKERFRMEIRKELSRLEMMCIDMASLLRGLGIQVEGGAYPTPQQVQAAYKRALLKFHPDRASKADIRQQVEAEEIFKLISRMKKQAVF